MTIPYYVNERQSDIRAIKPGWYGLERNGKLSSGPFQTRGNASLESLRRRAIFEHRPDLHGPREEQFSSIALVADIKCPECGNEHVRVCIRLDEYGRVWTGNSCETCGHILSPEEISGPVVVN